MKRNIVKLRILGITSFLLYIVSAMFSTSKTANYIFTQVQQILIIISFGSFAIVLAIQVYAFYIKTFAKEDEDDAN